MESSAPETCPVDLLPSEPDVYGGNLTFRSQWLSFYKMPDQKDLKRRHLAENKCLLLYIYVLLEHSLLFGNKTVTHPDMHC